MRAPRAALFLPEISQFVTAVKNEQMKSSFFKRERLDNKKLVNWHDVPVRKVLSCLWTMNGALHRDMAMAIDT